MKKTFQILLLILVLFSTQIITQDYIKEYNGIPLISSLPHDCGEYHFDTVKATGIKFIAISNLNSTRLEYAKNRGFKVIPVQLHDSLLDRPYSYILRYTEARYSKWEAEGTPPQDGLATLSYNDTIGTNFNEGNISGIVTKPNASAGTLIRGPGYRQEIYYTTKEPGDSIIYFADFRIKIETIAQGGLPTDTICILQVVDSKIQGPPQVNYYIGEIDFLRETVVRRQDLTPGVWKTFTIAYELTELDTVDIETMANRHSVDDSTWLPDRRYAQFIEFKVIWKGDLHNKLFVDDITVYDFRGNDLVTFPDIKSRIVTQANNSFNLAGWDTLVTAWYAFDEPESIDQYEPIRIVDSILNSQSNGRRRLFVSFPGSWNGKYGDSPFGAQPIYKHEEFFRRVKTIRMSNNSHIYGPYKEGDEGDYRLRNIDNLVNNILDRLNDIDSTFDMTLICGKYHKARIGRAPTPAEMFYEANLKLMFGAKSLSLYRYFGADNDTNFTGLVNYDTTWYEPQTGYYHYTDRYWFVRNTLAPRLNGLFGKTIRNLKQTYQYAGTDGVNTSSGNNCNKEYIKKIQAVQPDSNGLREGFMDLGFFNVAGGDNKKYFMLLNRYYSDVLLDKYDITIQYLFPYKNWLFTDYVDNNTYNICAASDWTFLFRDTITRGAAGLYGIKPVMIYGGTLNCDETILNSTTLNNDLIVNPGVTLTINDSLTSYGDIRLKDGSKLRTTNHSIGGTITFLQGKKLIIEGEVEISGLPDKKLTIDFTSRVNDNGIRVYDGNKLTIKNTLLKNAYKGIFVDGGELYIDSSEVIGCNRGLYLNNTNYQIDMHEGTKVWNSTFHENHCGIAFLESSAMVVGNDISNNRDYGVMCLENSSPVFGELLEPGLNRFGNTIGWNR